MPKQICKVCKSEVEVEEGYQIRICNGGFEHTTIAIKKEIKHVFSYEEAERLQRNGWTILSCLNGTIILVRKIK